MGNENSIDVKMANKLKDPEFLNRMDPEFREDASYHKYRLLKIQAEATCSHPFLKYSDKLQQDCARLQLQFLLAKVKTYSKTEGLAEWMDAFEKR